MPVGRGCPELGSHLTAHVYLYLSYEGIRKVWWPPINHIIHKHVHIVCDRFAGVTVQVPACAQYVHVRLWQCLMVRGTREIVGCILYVILQPAVRLYRTCLFNTLGSHVKSTKSGFDASARYGGGVKDFTRLAIG